MKNKGIKKLLSLILAVFVLASGFNFDLHAVADEREEGIYSVPVFLEHFYESGKASMGNAAIRKTVRVKYKDGKVTYTVYASDMVFGGLEGGVTNIFVYSSTDWNKVKSGSSSRTEASRRAVSSIGTNHLPNGKEAPFDTAFSFNRSTMGEETILIAVWVDAMDKLKSGNDDGSFTPGAGEQKAKLKLDWNNAVLVKSYAEEARKAEEEKKAKEEAEKKAKEEAEKKALEEQKAKEEAEQKAKEEAEKKAQEEKNKKEDEAKKDDEEEMIEEGSEGEDAKGESDGDVIDESEDDEEQNEDEKEDEEGVEDSQSDIGGDSLDAESFGANIQAINLVVGSIVVVVVGMLFLFMY